MKAVELGTTLLNHTVKNEIGKIAISTENLKQDNPNMGDESVQHLQIISNASDHMLAMVTRIHSQMKDIVLRETPCELDVLADECLGQHRELFESQGISLLKSYSCKPIVVCDSVHLKEAIGNLLMNAMESMTEGGTIEVGLDAVKRGIRLSFRDTGQGIPPDQLARVVDPFFSTKNDARNFGLGLSYVYNVMQKSGGTVELSSRVGEGTLAALYFPRQRVIHINRGDTVESN